MRWRVGPGRIVAVAVIVALGVGGAAAVVISREAAPSNGEDVMATTVAVTRGDLVQESTQQGFLGFADKRPLTAVGGGTLTSAATPGAIVSRGGVLYSLDASPVVLLFGSIPMWRAIEQGVDNGEDIRQLEQNLADMGLFTGDVDDHFTDVTAGAVRRWQKTLGREQSGVVSSSWVLIASGDVRVAGVEARIGDRLGDGGRIGVLSSPTSVVTVELGLEQQKLGAVGAVVSVRLPDGRELPGAIAAVGAPVDPPSDDEKSAPHIPVMISLNGQPDTGGFAEAQVSVRIPSGVVPDALTVPVAALIAIAPNTFAVQILDAERKVVDIPVELGAFQAGVVQISGDKVTEGLRVIVP